MKSAHCECTVIHATSTALCFQAFASRPITSTSCGLWLSCLCGLRPPSNTHWCWPVPASVPSGSSVHPAGSPQCFLWPANQWYRLHPLILAVLRHDSSHAPRLLWSKPRTGLLFASVCCHVILMSRTDICLSCTYCALNNNSINGDKGKGKGQETCYSAAYMSRTRDQQRCGHPLLALTDNWIHGAASRHTIAPISHTWPSPRSCSYCSFPVPLRVGGWVGLSTQ